MISSHLTVLVDSASRTPLSGVFRLPRYEPATNRVIEWQTITYQQFLHDVETAARYWTRLLANRGIPPRSTIGLWIGGFTYNDIVIIYGITRANYIPQLFTLRLPNPLAIYSLMQKAGARALVYEPCFAANVADAPVPTFLAVPQHTLDVTGAFLPALPSASEDDIAFVFHTSGSTSGSPKLVPCTYRWLSSAIQKSNQICKPSNTHRQDVTVWMGSLCHIAQTFMLLGSLQHGSCVIQPSKIDFSSEELLDMIERCGLNRLNQFSTFLSTHFRNARKDNKLLVKLQGLDEALYCGLSLPRDDEEWAMKNSIKIRNLFGSTECNAMLLSIGGKAQDAPFLRPMDGVSYSFQPIVSCGAERDQGHQSSARMLELVVLADSPDCPDISLRHQDGHFHTGDLFVEVAPGSYMFRGRDDDWIKTENSLRCDTKAIEDNIKATCGHLVKNCVAVGTGRPFPALFVEPMDSSISPDVLKQEIIRRTRKFNSMRYYHEQITLPRFITVVSQGTLPRTAKGNIRRKEVEEKYKTLLDQIYTR
ncbi:hypothetical protein APHAL10511_006294 [Amanita phalloides]|nr:hypothetical protein APHAL10511_006294 [Amanita phalloides]